MPLRRVHPTSRGRCSRWTAASARAVVSSRLARVKRVGVDVGGTHIDFVLVDDERREISIHKVPTSTRDPSIGAIEGLAELCRQAGIRPGDIDYFMHGTTIATNIILEHNGAKC